MTPTPNPSLQKKTASRIAAAQLLYSHTINDTALVTDLAIAELKNMLAHNKSEQKLRMGVAAEPNYTLLADILNGVQQWKQDIDTRLDSCISEGWTRTRMSPLLIAILQCAIFELFFYKDTKPAIIIDEYTRVTRAFFDAEVNFVHGALAALSARYHE